MNHPDIIFLRNDEIDRFRWDESIASSANSIAYAYSWYLDRICSHWDALITGDYSIVMPLVNRRKYGISYIYQPFFTQQLGIFSKAPITQEIIRHFFSSIPQKFRLTDINLNTGNHAVSSIFSTKLNTTYHLPLQPDEKTIRSNYNNNTRRNILKASQNQICIEPVHDIGTFLDFTRQNLRDKVPEVKDQHYMALGNVIKFALNNGYGQILSAQNTHGKWLSAVFFLIVKEQAIYLAATSSPEGIEKSAMFLLIDTFIQNHSGTNLTLDFEGSNIQGIARFYAGFGALPKSYHSVHLNRLPRIIRFLK